MNIKQLNEELIRLLNEDKEDLIGEAFTIFEKFKDIGERRNAYQYGYYLQA